MKAIKIIMKENLIKINKKMKKKHPEKKHAIAFCY